MPTALWLTSSEWATNAHHSRWYLWQWHGQSGLCYIIANIISSSYYHQQKLAMRIFLLHLFLIRILTKDAILSLSEASPIHLKTTPSTMQIPSKPSTSPRCNINWCRCSSKNISWPSKRYVTHFGLRSQMPAKHSILWFAASSLSSKAIAISASNLKEVRLIVWLKDKTYITITFSTTISIYQMDSDDIVSQMSARYLADSIPSFYLCKQFGHSIIFIRLCFDQED